MNPLIYAHRGASAYAPENTMSAFHEAARRYADGIELDVQMTKDGVIVVMHDEDVSLYHQQPGAGAGKDPERN